MKKYIKKPIPVEASRWFKIGDHHRVLMIEPAFDPMNNVKLCKQCGKSLVDHGKISTLEGSHIVCPGDYIVKGIRNEYWAVKPDIFEETYEEVND